MLLILSYGVKGDIEKENFIQNSCYKHYNNDREPEQLFHFVMGWICDCLQDICSFVKWNQCV